MAKRYGYPVGIVVLTTLLLAVALHANGGMIFFTDRVAFERQFDGSLDRFNFDTFAEPTLFPVGRANAINFGGFSVSQTAFSDSGGSFFDVSPFVEVGIDPVPAAIDGTPYANIFLNDSTSVEFVFSTPVLGFGGDFRGFSGAINFTVFPFGKEPSISRAINFQSSFVGVTSPDPISRIQFQYAGESGGFANFAFDNAALSAVPEPASLLLWGIGATLLGGYGYARWHNRQQSQTAPEKEQA